MSPELKAKLSAWLTVEKIPFDEVYDVDFDYADSTVDIWFMIDGKRDWVSLDDNIVDFLEFLVAN
jgi:hypothetical protein